MPDMIYTSDNRIDSSDHQQEIASEMTVRTKRPTWWKGIIFTLLLGLVVAGMVYAALFLRSEEGPKLVPATSRAISVSVMTLEPGGSFNLEEKFTGLAEARRSSQLGFASGGRIIALSADVGDRVAQGRTLAKLDTRGLNAELGSSQAVIEEARAAHALALSTVERQRILMERGHVSQQRVDEAEAQANTSLARIEAAKARAETLRIAIDLARIKAPFTGVITKRFVDEGAIAGPGTPVFELVETGHLEARIGVPASVAATLKTGNTYTLTTNAGDVEAKLRSVTGVIERGQRTEAAIFDILDNDSLPAGAIVRLSVERDVEEDGVWVPVKALSAASRGLWTVYVVRPDEHGWVALSQPVEMVHSEGDKAYVRGTLKSGDKIITEGLQRITPGMSVVPREEVSADNSDQG